MPEETAPTTQPAEAPQPQTEVAPSPAPEQPTPAQTPAKENPEVVLQKFLDEQKIEIELPPMGLKQIEGGGLLIEPAKQLIVKYKD